jgi:hypothetical protein
MHVDFPQWSFAAMSTPEIVAVSLNTLNRLFSRKLEGKVLRFQNILCVGCGQLIDITIQKASEGIRVLEQNSIRAFQRAILGYVSQL